MNLPISPPQDILFVAAALFAVILFTSLRKGLSPRTRIIRIAVGAIVIGGMLIFIYRPSTITIDARGITSNSGGKLSIPWQEITRVSYVSDLHSSPYRTTAKIRGVAFGDYRVGTFHTASGASARVVAQQSGAALLVETKSRLYEFAPHRLAQMTAEVARYLSVSGWPPAGVKQPDQASPESSSPTP